MAHIRATGQPLAYNDQNRKGEPKQPDLLRIFMGVGLIFIGLGTRRPWNIFVIVGGGMLIAKGFDTQSRRPAEGGNLASVWTVAAFAAGFLANLRPTSPRGPHDRRTPFLNLIPRFAGTGARAGGAPASQAGWTRDSTLPDRTRGYDSGDESSSF